MSDLKHQPKNASAEVNSAISTIVLVTQSNYDTLVKITNKNSCGTKPTLFTNFDNNVNL